MDKQNLIYSTVQLRNDNCEGTGVIVDLTMEEGTCVPVIITNKHVIEGFDDIAFALTVQNEDGSYGILECILKGAASKCVFHDACDLCAIPLSYLINETKKLNRMIAASFVSIDEIAMADDFIRCDAIADVYVIGYPNSFRDMRNNLPIAKKGVTSTPLFSDYDGRKEFLVDCGILKGNSGSPVYIKVDSSNYKLAGIIYATKNMSLDAYFYDGDGRKHCVDCWVSSGIGIAIKAQEILDLAFKINSMKTDL